MKMNQFDSLGEIKIEEIRKLAREERQKLGFIETPIANDMFTVLDNLKILLMEYPIKSDSEKPAFSAAMMYSEEDGNELVFIGLNTADYYDKQLFALAHELYHYYTRTGSHLSRPEDEGKNIIEASANRFAAEFLLPENVLRETILDEFRVSSIVGIKIKTLVRFIARLQCTWWLPYRSIVKRLREIDAISDNQYEELYSIDERDIYGEYAKVGKAINSEVFSKLNSATNTIGTSAKDIEVIIRNFEDQIINEDVFADTLRLFGKSPDDFGYSITASKEDFDEFEAYFCGEGEDEG